MSDEIAIRARLETGDAVSNANQLTQALGSLGQAMQKAAIAGDTKGVTDYASALLKYKKAVGMQDAEEQTATTTAVSALKQSPLFRVLENATKVISRAPNYIGAMGGGNPAGAALGIAGDAAKAGETAAAGGVSTGALAAAGVGVAVVAAGMAANKLSEQYEKVMQPAMRLAATLGALSGKYQENSDAISLAFNMAAKSASRFGFTIEEGMTAVEQLAKLGVTSYGAYGAASHVFQYERGTGADRSLLMQAEALGRRYNAGNALGYGLGGTEASGMQQGQYQEYLNATLRIFEEGLSKGVVKGFGEVTRTQNFVAALGNGSQLWKGEQGYQRYRQMSDSVTGATSLEREYDVITYQAMRSTIDKARSRGFKDDKDGAWSQYAKYGSGSYVEVMRAMEGGLTPELFEQQMKTIVTQIAGGTQNRPGVIEGIRKQYGINYNAASDVYDSYLSGSYKGAVSTIKEPASAESPEQKLLSLQQDIRTNVANIGKWVLPGKVEVMSALNSIVAAVAGDRWKASLGRMTEKVAGSSADKADRDTMVALLQKAFKEGTPDEQNAAGGILSWISSLSTRQSSFLDENNVLNGMFKGKGLESLPALEQTLQGLFGNKTIASEYSKYSASVDRMDDKGAGAAFAAAVPWSYKGSASGTVMGKKVTRPGGDAHQYIANAAASGNEEAKILMDSIWNRYKGGPDEFFATVGGAKALRAFDDARSAATKPDSPGGSAVTYDEGVAMLRAVLSEFQANMGETSKAMQRAAENMYLEVVTEPGAKK